MVIPNLEKLKGYQILSYLFLFLALTIPGVGYLYLSEYEKFLNLEFGKLMLVSIFYSFPIFVFGVVDYFFNEKGYSSRKAKSKNLKKQMDEIVLALYYISAFTLVSFYCSLCIYFLSSIFKNLLIIMYLVSPALIFIFRILIDYEKALETLKRKFESF